MKSIVLWVVLLGVVGACGVDDSVATPTPDLQATIDAAVVATATAVETATPTATPTSPPTPTATGMPTATPTLAPTATPKPTPTPVATAAPTPVLSGIEVTSLGCTTSFFGVIDPSGETHQMEITGTAVNRTSMTQLWSGFTITLLGSDGVVASQESFDPPYATLPRDTAVDFNATIAGSSYSDATACTVHFDLALGGQLTFGESTVDVETVYFP